MAKISEKKHPLVLSSLVKALSVLDYLMFIGIDENGASLADLSSRLQLAPNTLHKILKTLCECGYARQLRRGRYCAGQKFAHLLAEEYPVSTDLKKQIALRLGEFAEDQKESCACSVLRNGDRFVVAKVNGSHVVQVPQQFIDEEPFYSRTSSKMLMAHATENELSQIINKHGLPGTTWNNISEESELKKELARIRNKKYLVTENPEAEVISAVAPITLQDGSFWGVVGSYAPSYRITPRRKGPWISSLCQTAEKINKQLCINHIKQEK